MGVALNPDSFVLHADYGPARVLGMQADALAGQCLAIAPMRAAMAVVRIPVAKAAGSLVRSLSAAEAEQMAAAPEDQRGFKWKARRRWT